MKLSNITTGICAFLLGSSAIFAYAAETSDVWPTIKQNLFGDRAISEDTRGAVITLQAPVRADDAASVPIVISVPKPQSERHYVSKLWLIVDKNPSPIAGVFSFTPQSGLANLETRIRVEDYSHIRAVAESSDGKLFMHTRYIKASGGCSAPAAAGPNMATLGRMKFRFDQRLTLNEPNQAQLMISHPNISGLAKDQLTHLYPTPDYVKQVDVSYADQAVMNAQVDFSISENPVFRFFFHPKDKGELKAKIVDTSERKFEHAVSLSPDAAVAGSQ